MMKKNGNSNKDNPGGRYRLVLSNEHTHKQLWFFNFTKVGLTIFVVSIIFVALAIVYSLIAFTPIRTFIPGYPDAYTKSEAINNAIKVDSLENVIYKWNLYSENLKRVLTGEETIKLDSIARLDSAIAEPAIPDPTKDSILREVVREEEMFEVGREKRNLPIEGMHFFVPLKGVISQKYDNLMHPYVDITAPKNAVVMSTLDGTVVYAGWSDDAGYMLCIQHENDILSVYKHNSKLLKKTGDKVQAGTPVALVGNTGSLTTGDHLHFELWYNGSSVNPEHYMSF